MAYLGILKIGKKYYLPKSNLNIYKSMLSSKVLKLKTPTLETEYH